MHYKSICDAILKRIRAAIKSESFLDQFKEPKRFTRKRLVSMYQVIIYLFYSNKAAMGTNISNIRDILPELDFPKISRQAVSKARQNIKSALFQELLDITVRTYYLFTQFFNLWNSFHLFAIDGTRVHMPYSKSVANDFGFQGDSRYDKKHYMGLGSILYDISQDYIVDAEIGHVHSSERDFARMHVKKLAELGLVDHSLIIFDRGYFSIDMFNYLIDSGCNCLMRIKKDVTSLTRSDEDDTVFDIAKYHADIRVIKVMLCTGETEYLVTNILNPELTPEMFKELYHKRWKIESKYYEIKEHWELEQFNGSTSRSIEQEFYITLIKSNFCSIIKQEADRIIKAQACEKNTREYQSTRAHLIGRLSVLFPMYLIGQHVTTTLHDLVMEGVRHKSLIQPERHDQRKMPKVHKIHSKNRKTTT